MVVICFVFWFCVVILMLYLDLAFGFSSMKSVSKQSWIVIQRLSFRLQLGVVLVIFVYTFFVLFILVVLSLVILIPSFAVFLAWEGVKALVVCIKHNLF